MNQPNLSSFIWSVADLLRGDYKQSELWQGDLAVDGLHRLDCVLESTKEVVLKELEKREAAGLNPEPFLLNWDALAIDGMHDSAKAAKHNLQVTEEH